jgi:WD40 repeat protein
VIEK